MIRQHRAEPCWELVRPDTKRPPQETMGDGWPHYATAAEALADLAEQQDYWGGELIVQRSFGAACVGIFCDGCDALFNDDEYTHLDPVDVWPGDIEDADWFDPDNGKHYCPKCAPPWCDDCDERHHPDDRHVPEDERPAAWRPVPISEGQGVLL